MGTGVYIDDVDKEIDKRKKQMVEDLRKILRNLKIARTGYVYIFDSKMNMIIHPNKNIEGKNFADLPDPMTGKSIGRELIEASKTKKGELTYTWDKPDDPGNYIYKKKSWVKYFKPFDWYIASSVYEQELTKTSRLLHRRILEVASFILILSLFIGYIVVKRFIDPILVLADVTKKGKTRRHDSQK